MTEFHQPLRLTSEFGKPHNRDIYHQTSFHTNVQTFVENHAINQTSSKAFLPKKIKNHDESLDVAF